MDPHRRSATIEVVDEEAASGISSTRWRRSASGHRVTRNCRTGP